MLHLPWRTPIGNKHNNNPSFLNKHLTFEFPNNNNKNIFALISYCRAKVNLNLNYSSSYSNIKNMPEVLYHEILTWIYIIQTGPILIGVLTLPTYNISACLIIVTLLLCSMLMICFHWMHFTSRSLNSQAWTHLRPPPIHHPMEIPRFTRCVSH